jgi:muramoyltetrapeptide carboxypeptidase LdcA involved in peptidoglycan recycling
VDACVHLSAEELGLVPVEYPTTRAAGASPHERARDLNAAFADPEISAVLATIGGDDQIRVLRHLDPEVLGGNPKPFFGYSDNTNLLHFLWRLGVVGYHGGSVMVHLARSGGTHPLSMDSLRAALFTRGGYDLRAPDGFADETVNWAEPGWLDTPAPTRAAAAWTWDGRTDRVVEAPLWGGNLEIISWLAQAGRLGPVEAYAGSAFLLETSEELPPATEVYRILRHLGERGVLGLAPAVLVGRAKAWHFDRRLDLREREVYAAEQRAAVLRALSEYAPEALVVFDLDIGHTDPQLILPIGGTVRVDGPGRGITVFY